MAFLALTCIAAIINFAWMVLTCVERKAFLQQVKVTADEELLLSESDSSNNDADEQEMTTV